MALTQQFSNRLTRLVLALYLITISRAALILPKVPEIDPPTVPNIDPPTVPDINAPEFPNNDLPTIPELPPDEPTINGGSDSLSEGTDHAPLFGDGG
jgi:hypothetical protein